MNALYVLMGCVATPLARGLYRLKVRGLEQVPQEGGFVLASNHWSNIDPWVLSIPFFPRRDLRYLAKAELFTPLTKGFLTASGAFPVRRGEGDIEAFKTAVRLVRSGEILVVFPQGHRQLPGEMERGETPFHTGAARIALAAGAPLVPAAVKGTERLKELAKLSVAYGPADPLEDLAKLPNRRAADLATERLRTSIFELYASL